MEQVPILSKPRVQERETVSVGVPLHSTPPATDSQSGIAPLHSAPLFMSGRRRAEGWYLNSTVSASSRTPFYLASAASRREPAAAYGLAPYAICVRLQPRLTPSLHPAPNSTGHLLNARFSVGANFNVITRPKDAARNIYMFFGRSRAAACQLSYVIH